MRSDRARIQAFIGVLDFCPIYSHETLPNSISTDCLRDLSIIFSFNFIFFHKILIFLFRFYFRIC